MGAGISNNKTAVRVINTLARGSPHPAAPAQSQITTLKCGYETVLGKGQQDAGDEAGGLSTARERRRRVIVSV